MTDSAANSTVWITGAGGLMGHWLVRTAPQFAPKVRPRGLCRSELDLQDFSAVRQAFARERPAAIIHCAALSKSPDCQTQPALARRLNTEVTAVLAELAADIPFVLFSTDLVFDGQKGRYTETDAVNPLSVYAETKAAAEQIVCANPRHTVIRTSLNGGISPTGDRGFNEQIRRAWTAGKELSFFADEYRSPIPVVATVRATWELLRQRQSGILHVAGAERLSRAEIGAALASRWPELPARFTVGSLRDYHGAPRAPDTSLDCAKAQALLSFALPGLTTWLQANPAAAF